jgi:hypothetical protein
MTPVETASCPLYKCTNPAQRDLRCWVHGQQVDAANSGWRMSGNVATPLSVLLQTWHASLLDGVHCCCLLARPAIAAKAKPKTAGSPNILPR